MEVKEGKWRTRGGEVVTVSRGGNDRYPWKCVHSTEKFVLVTDNGRANLTYGENVHDLIAPVHEITPGSYWRLKGSDTKWFVIGRRKSGDWIVEHPEGWTASRVEPDFLATWTDPPKPRVIKAWACVDNEGMLRLRETKHAAESVALRDRAFPVVEVTLTEEVNHV